MSKNFITSGFINPKELSLEQVRTSVATLLKIPIQNIERLELWRHQIWIKFVHGRGKFISYRQLPLWLEAGLRAIARCHDQTLLKQIAQALTTERDWYENSLDLECQQKWRQVIERWNYAWGEKAKQLQLEEERLQPLRDHQKAAQDWLSGWQQVLPHWEDCASFNHLASEIKRQSQKFADLPDILQEIQQTIQQRRLELFPSHPNVDAGTRGRGDAERG